ncbi:hypothetical protein EDB80DRAFT_61257 [Ilyonectria destructans]|nr:hypothetical protein EDB80DRAFT_61257 [Ilyonectria destructans]
MTFHKCKRAAPFVCTRCQERFTTIQDCQAHLRVPPDRICQTKDPGDDSSSEDDPEDGITSEIEEVLRDRRAYIQVVGWDALWRTLFPTDSTIESAEFEPVIEDYEVQHDFEECSGEWQSFLRAEAIRMLSNPTQASPDKLHPLFQTLVNRTLQGCRSRVLGSYARVSRRRQRTADEQNQAASSSRSSSTLTTHQRRLLPTPDSIDQRSPPPPSSTTSRPAPMGIDESWHQNMAQPQATNTSDLEPSQFGGGVLLAAAVHQYDTSNVTNQWPDVCVICQGPRPCDCDRGFDSLGA